MIISTPRKQRAGGGGGACAHHGVRVLLDQGCLGVEVKFESDVLSDVEQPAGLALEKGLPPPPLHPGLFLLGRLGREQLLQFLRAELFESDLVVVHPLGVAALLPNWEFTDHRKGGGKDARERE